MTYTSCLSQCETKICHAIKLKVLKYYFLFSVAMNTYAVMGVNTAVLQANVVFKAHAYTILPAKINARLDIKEGDFKIEALPVHVPENITSIK